MKPCRKQNQTADVQRPAAAQRPAVVQRPTAMQEATVRRYVHPIRTVSPPARSTTEEMLSYVLEALSRQSEQLDMMLRLLEGDNSDTM